VETREGRWEVRVAGATRSGTGPDAGASLLLLVFSSEDEPELPPREILTAGRSLEALTDEDLEELLARSRPRPPA
jgi:hypothetical protein